MSPLFKARLGVIILVLSILLGLGGVWYWALFRITEDIGIALTVTCGVLFLVGVIIHSDY